MAEFPPPTVGIEEAKTCLRLQPASSLRRTCSYSIEGSKCKAIFAIGPLVSTTYAMGESFVIKGSGPLTNFPHLRTLTSKVMMWWPKCLALYGWLSP